MQKVTVSAPGKLMLLGEHAVVYGFPCLVTAVGQRMQASVELIDEPVLLLDAPEVNISGYKKSMKNLGTGDVPKGAKFVELAVKNFIEKGGNIPGGVHITTASEFSSLFGFGSSSASSVCTVGALQMLTGNDINKRICFDTSYKTVLDVQGKGSGFDLAAAIYGGTLSFTTPGKNIEPLAVPPPSIVIGYTGIKADTVTIVNEVSERMKKDPDGIAALYKGMAALAERGIAEILRGDITAFGKTMNENQELLSQLNVSSPILDALIAAARGAGALGAKLSGAGKGDCMIALVTEEQRTSVAKAIQAVGGQVIDILAGVEGLRAER